VPTVEDSVTINRSPEDVWAFLTDPDNLTTYESQVTELEQLTEGEVAAGTRFRGVSKVLGRPITWTSEIVRFEPVSAYATKTVEAKLPFAVAWTLTPEGDGTRMDYRLEAESGLGGVFGKLGEPVVVKAQQRTLRTNLANLKALLESGAL
jgi:ligand-binding SRPBCC domain-containing protein